MSKENELPKTTESGAVCADEESGGVVVEPCALRLAPDNFFAPKGQTEILLFCIGTASRPGISG